MENSPIRPKTRYSYPKYQGLSCSKDNPKSVSRTQQHFGKDANVNTIMKKYGKSGLLTDPTIKPTREPFYGDFSSVPTFMDAQNKMVDVKNWFNTLPPEIRSKFNNNPFECQAWIINPENKEDAQELGLLPKPATAKYTDKDGKDITSEVVETRGLFRNGVRINEDGTPFVEPVKPETPIEEPSI